ncbi:DUF5808 domain-containing protein [Cuniculiplasma sp. SKW3]|uniref:DUF5808 domain-containing protein n=1 Tax=Cuniculiplasma sp. SKW3 TaxID=3400170 RepID=UPI003FD5C896
MIHQIYIYYILGLLPLIIISMFFAMTPLITPPEIQFGIRIGSADAKSRSIRYMKYEYAVLEIVGVSFTIAVLTYIFGLNLSVEFFGIFIFLAFSWILYGIFRLRVRNIKKVSEKQEESVIMNAVILDETVKVKKWVGVFPWIEILILLITASFVNPHIHYLFHPSRFLSLLLFPIILTSVMEVMAFLILRASPFQNPKSPVKSALQMSKFNRANFYLIILISLIINFNIILSPYLMSGMNGRVYVYIDLLFPSFLLLGVMIIGYRYGQTGWKLFPWAVETRSGKISRDDDNLWIFGVIYHNREDPAILVPKRFGFGYTLNFGNPLGLLLITAILIGTVLIPYALYFP